MSRHTKIVIIAALIVFIVVVSAVLAVSIPKLAPKPTPTPTATAPPAPTVSPTTAPTPTQTTSPQPTEAITQPPSTTTYTLYPGEVTQYQGISLTPVNEYISLTQQHPDVHIEGVQTVDPSTYQLAITGMVYNPQSLSYSDVVSLNSTLQVATLPCVEGWSVTMLWQGIPITNILQQAGGAGPDANTLIFKAADGYTTSLPLSFVQQNNIMIAYKMNNVTLTPQTGWPFFLVANNQYGYKWIEWITEINVSNDSSYLGYWESRGYPNNATVTGPSSSLPPVNGNTVTAVVIGVAVFAIIAAAYVTWQKKERQTNRTMARHAQSEEMERAFDLQRYA